MSKPAGVNEHLTEKVTRSPFYISHCATADILTISEYIMDADYIGGLFGGSSGKDRCTPFICLIFRIFALMSLKTSQKQQHSREENDEDEEATTTSIISFLEEFIQQPHHKYLRVFGLICLRLLGVSGIGGNVNNAALKLHKTLDVGFLDYRRVRVMLPNGNIVVSTVDQVCNMLLFPSVYTSSNLMMNTNTNTNNMNNDDQTATSSSASLQQQNEFLGLRLPLIPTRKQMIELFPREEKNLLHC